MSCLVKARHLFCIRGLKSVVVQSKICYGIDKDYRLAVQSLSWREGDAYGYIRCIVSV